MCHTVPEGRARTPATERGRGDRAPRGPGRFPAPPRPQRPPRPPEGKVRRGPVNNSAGRALAARGAGRSPLPAAEATSRKRGRRRPPPRRPPPASPPRRPGPRAAPHGRAARTARRRADPPGKDARDAEPLTRAEAPRGPTDGGDLAQRAARAAVR